MAPFCPQNCELLSASKPHPVWTGGRAQGVWVKMESGQRQRREVGLYRLIKLLGYKLGLFDEENFGYCKEYITLAWSLSI